MDCERKYVNHKKTETTAGSERGIIVCLENSRNESVCGDQHLLELKMRIKKDGDEVFDDQRNKTEIEETGRSFVSFMETTKPQTHTCPSSYAWPIISTCAYFCYL